MVMLFSSYGFCSPIMREKYALAIPHGESLKRKSCVIIPYAGFDMKKTAEREKQGLVEFGFNPDNIYVLNDIGFSGCEFPDYIYVAGGDPFKLLDIVKKNLLPEKIRNCVIEKRAVYIGVSAGAYLATNNIEYITQVEDNNVINHCFDALGLVPANILCHYDHYSYLTLKACEEVGGRQCVTINDDQLLMYESGKWIYIGED
ncbi:MAG: Type 1 glutamine amidotransferase-like domain-containing protein [Ruminococcus sp.]